MDNTERHHLARSPLPSSSRIPDDILEIVRKVLQPRYASLNFGSGPSGLFFQDRGDPRIKVSLDLETDDALTLVVENTVTGEIWREKLEDRPEPLPVICGQHDIMKRCPVPGSYVTTPADEEAIRRSFVEHAPANIFRSEDSLNLFVSSLSNDEAECLYELLKNRGCSLERRGLSKWRAAKDKEKKA